MISRTTVKGMFPLQSRGHGRFLGVLLLAGVTTLTPQVTPPESQFFIDSTMHYLPGPNLSASTEQLIFEGLLPGESRTLFMDLANLGDGVIQLDSLTVSDEAVLFALPLIRIDPGQFVRFPVTFSQSDLDTHQVTVTIYWRSPQFELDATLQLAVQSTPRPPIELSMTEIFWGNAVMGAEQFVSVNLTNMGSQTIYFTDDPQLPPQVRLAPLPPVIPGGRSTDISIFWQPPDGNPLDGRLEIPYRVGAASGSVILLLYGSVQPAVRLIPELLLLGSTSAGGSYHTQVAVINDSQAAIVLIRKPLETDSAPAEWLELPATIAVGPGERAEFSVVFLPQQAGLFEMDIPFALESPTDPVSRDDAPTVVLTVRAAVDLPLSLVTHDLDFGDQPVLETTRLSLMMENRGSAPLNLALSLQRGSEMFAYPPIDFPLAPGEQLDIPIYYRPTDMVSYHDTLVIRYATFDTNHESHIALRGAGVDRPLVRLRTIEDVQLEEDPPSPYLLADLNDIFEDANHQVSYFVSHAIPASVSLTVETNGRLMLTTEPNYYGSDRIIVQAMNELGHVVADTFELLITPVNDLPQLVAPIPDLVVKEDTPSFVVAKLSTMFHDPDLIMDTVITYYSIHGPGDEHPVQLSKQADNLVLEIAPDWFGSTDFVVSARDANDSTAAVFDAFRVTVLAVNDPPVIDSLPLLSLDEDHTLELDWRPYVQDRDHSDDELILSLHIPAGTTSPITLEQPSPLMIIVTPRADWFGDLPVTLTVTDPLGASTSRDLTIHVASVNDPPQPFHLIEPFVFEWEDRLRYAGLDTLLTFKWELSPNLDPDDHLIYTWQLLDSTGQRVLLERPAGLANSVQTHLSGSGVFFWTVEVRDDEGATALSDTLPIILEAIRPQSLTSDPALYLGIGPNYPNPFSEYTQIEYTIPNYSDVVIIIYDSVGRRVKLLMSDKQYRGQYVVNWDGRDLQGQRVASGPYVAELRAGSFMAHLKLVVVR